MAILRFMTEEKKKAKSALLRLLAKRDYPSEALKQKLLGKGFSEEIAKEMLDWAKEQGFVDDARYIGAFVNQEIRRCRSPVAIRWKLRAKGLSPEVAPQISRATQKEQIKKLLPKLSSDRRKAMGALYRRGFSSELISEVFRQLQEK